MNGKYSRLAMAAGLAALLYNAGPASAQTAPSMGSAAPYAVLGGSTVTNTGPTVITGDLGVSPGSAITGFPPGSQNAGATHVADANALAAQGSATTAAGALTAQACTTTFAVPTDIGGSTLTPGVYCFASSAAITGTVTLNALGNPNSVFIFITGSTLTTASGSRVAYINGGSACNTFWRIGSSAILGTTTSFQGTIIALASVTLNTNATIVGRAIAQTGAVTMDTNTVNVSACSPLTSCPLISISPSTLPNGIVGEAYSQTLTATGSSGSYVFTIVNGGFPPGLSMSTAGVVSGTPTNNTGTYDVLIRAGDSSGCSAFGFYTMTNVVAVPTLPQAFLFLLAALLAAVGYSKLNRRDPRVTM